MLNLMEGLNLVLTSTDIKASLCSHPIKHYRRLTAVLIAVQDHPTVFSSKMPSLRLLNPV